MTIQTTRWTPDTCGVNPPCIIEYTWDDSVPPDSRVHTFSTYIQKCVNHSGLADVSGYAVVTEENPRKNIARQLIIDNAPPAFVNVGTSGVKTLLSGLSINFTVSGVVPNRVFGMIFTGTTLTSGQISNVQNRLDTRFGTDRVIFINSP